MVETAIREKEDELTEKEKEITEIIEKSFLKSYLENGITDIGFDGAQLKIKHNTKGIYKAEKQPNKRDVELLVKRIADIQGASFTETDPILDTQANYFRINAVHSIVSVEGVTLALRVSKPSKAMKRLADVCSEDAEQLLSVLVKADTSIVLSGMTGSGKTEFQKMLVGEIDDDKKIGLAEDTLDSHLKKLYPNKYILSYRTLLEKNRDNKIAFPDLIKAFLRNDIDWGIISEVRDSPTARAMMEAVKTGHMMMTTLHTPRASKIPDRLVDLVGEGYSINELLYGKNIVENLPIGAHMAYRKNKQTGEIERYTREIVEFLDFNENGTVFNTVYQQKNVHMGDGKYETQIVTSPVSDKLMEHLEEKEMIHLLPDIFRP